MWLFPHLWLTAGPAPAHAAPDWPALGDEAARLLSAYLAVDTTNPPGNEREGALFLAHFLAQEGIESKLYEFAPGRANLVARLEGRTGAPPICLLSHIDVASSEPARWQHPPLSGAIADGYVWGRGALDMKGLGAVEALAMAVLVREGVVPERDVLLVAVGDEEVDNQGVQHLVAHHWGEVGCGYVLNEGGIGLKDMFFAGQTVFPISVGEKGFVWSRMVASGHPGHGSTPFPGQAPEKLLRAAQKLQDRRAKPRFHEALLELVGNVGRHKGGLSGAILRRPWLVRTLLKRKFMNNPLTRAAITDTANVTGFGGARETNVVPSEVWANVDARIMPGTDPAAHIAHLSAVVGDPDVRFEVQSQVGAGVSEWRGDPFYAALVAAVEGTARDVVAGPVISVGFTDSIYLRPLGVRAYGLAPFAVTEQEAAGMHGDDERVAVAELARGVRVIYTAISSMGSE